MALRAEPAAPLAGAPRSASARVKEIFRQAARFVYIDVPYPAFRSCPRKNREIQEREGDSDDAFCNRFGFTKTAHNQVGSAPDGGRSRRLRASEMGPDGA